MNNQRMIVVVLLSILVVLIVFFWANQRVERRLKEITPNVERLY